MDPPVSLVVPEPVTAPRNEPSTRYSRDHGAFVREATGSMDSFAADTDSTQPSSVGRTPGVPEGIGALGGAGAGPELAAGVTTGSAGGSVGSAIPCGAVAVAISMQTPTKLASR